MAHTNTPQESIPFINALLCLGKVLRAMESVGSKSDPAFTARVQQMDKAILKASQKNPWFTPAHCRLALQWWGQCLHAENIREWLAAYGAPHNDPARIAIIMAGNIPVVGFHDLIAVLVTGHSAVIKASSKDNVLIPAMVSVMADADSAILSKIQWADGPLPEFDGVIATGSTNTSRYFEFYFGKKPNIIRRNRTAVAVLNGEESDEDLRLLGDDLFQYFGLGCRNVSKLYLPRDFDLKRIIAASSSYRTFMDHHKYANNYDYHKAIYLMGEQAFTDGEFCLLLESEKIASPLATIHYERYGSLDAVTRELTEMSDQIQCIVARCGIPGELEFGQAQRPQLSQYADDVDTVEFLLKTSFK